MKYVCGNRTAIVNCGTMTWGIWVYEGSECVATATGDTIGWRWYVKMKLCSLARDWCAHGVSWVQKGRSARFQLPRSGVCSIMPIEWWPRYRAERDAVRRVP